MLKIPINAVSMRGWDRLYKQAREMRIRQNTETEEDAFMVTLEMPNGEQRYLIGNDDELKILDTRQLCAFLRKHTELKGFTFYISA